MIDALYKKYKNMNKRYLTLSVMVLAIALVAFSVLDDKKDKVLMDILSESLNNGHYSPKVIDDNFSKDVFKLYLERSDYSKRFLLQSDVNKLKAYELKIDDEINENSFEFFNLSNEILTERVEHAKSIYKEILNEAFDFSIDETIESDPDKISFAKNEEELKDYWRKYLKYNVMVKLADAIEAQKKALEKKDTAFTEKSFEEMEAEARKKVLKTHDDWFRRLGQMDKDDRLSIYLNCITGVYDPHTGYFPPKDKENFDISMSGQLEGIGATLTESDGYIKIVDIVPGSPSSKIEDIMVNTLILKVAQASAEPVDVVDMRLDDAVKLIRGKKGTEVRLTIKKLDGTIKVVSIIRDVINIEETYAKSAVLKDEKSKNSFGYIYLPKFYANFNESNGHFCSKDVLAEIEKLKKDNIEGLILDLRDNGGGSLMDAVDMSGYFIEEGPIVQVKAKVGKAQILNDTDRRIQWNGPLIVLVNSLSASASEILAAALQDYDRAIIVGSPTFGKGTVQRFFDLDDFVRGNEPGVKPLGAVKLTIQKFYRINGGSTQLKGVTPDILLPDAYQMIDMGEKDQDFPMEWTEIPAVEYSDYDRLKSIDKLKQKSKERIVKNNEFGLINQQAQWIKNQNENTLTSLKLETYISESKKEEANNKKFSEIGKNLTSVNIIAASSDQLLMKNDSAKNEIMSSWFKKLKKDVYIEECFEILKDYK